MDTLSLLVRNPRWWMTPLLAGLFLLMATSARAQTPQPSLPQPTSARVELFSPQGTAKNTRQVTARFSEPMVTFGDPRGPEPFTITCPALGRAHWADSQNWVYDFDRDLPGGVECRFVLKPDLKTLAGNSLSATAAFVFNTGGPRIIQSFPDTYQPIDAQQIFVLTLDAEADPDTIRDRVRCVVAGQPEPLRIKLLTGQERAKVLAFLEKGFARDGGRPMRRYVAARDQSQTVVGRGDSGGQRHRHRQRSAFGVPGASSIHRARRMPGWQRE